MAELSSERPPGTTPMRGDYVIAAQSVPQVPVSLRNLAFAVHGLYAASIFTGFTPVIGVIIAYIKRGEASGTIYESHFTYAIRTFWIGLAMGVVSLLLVLMLIGLLLLPLVGVWFVIRIVRAFLALMDDKPIANPSRFF